MHCPGLGGGWGAPFSDPGLYQELPKHEPQSEQSYSSIVSAGAPVLTSLSVECS